MNPFRPVKTRRVFEEICEQIRNRLANGELRPGDRLPAERDLALEFGVSRPAVREAMRTLEMSGVIALHKGVKGGAFIREGNPEALTQSLQDLLVLGQVTVRDLAEMREVLNVAMVRLACERGTEEDFAALAENIDLIESSSDLELRADAGIAFFQLIAQAARNEVLIILVRSLSDVIRYVIDRTGRKAKHQLIPIRRRLLMALRARDPEVAVDAMNEYLAIVHEGMDVDVDVTPAHP